ncbi:MAG: polyphosphate kinase 1 [Thermoplasmatales archaeon]|nr:polyphosphate kinase 1 [Thermoplasmatales archaeon]
MSDINLYDPKLYINREYSWLEFNRRCLDEAKDPEVPLLERLKFLAICHSNLDEFFMIRVPGIIDGFAPGAPILNDPDIDPDTTHLLSSIDAKVRELMDEYSECWKTLRKALVRRGIRILPMSKLNEEQLAVIDEFYRERVHPLLTPLALDISHPFPFISNNALNIAVKMDDPNGRRLYSRIKVPLGPLDRFIRIPSEQGTIDFVMLEDIVRHNVALLFPGFKILGAHAFRVTRNADPKVALDEACDLLSAVEEYVEGRDMGFPVRMVAEHSMPDEMAGIFGRNLGLSNEQIHRSHAPLMLNSLWEIHGLNIPSLREKEFKPHCPPELAEGNSLFPAIAERDWMLYHPYESFGIIVRLLQEAAHDPSVQSIKISLYRIGKDPSIIQALKTARERGKNVSVLMEIRAKFDETNNIYLARSMERLGIHVVFGPVGLKVHCKLMQIVRLEAGHLVRYTHMSSGNYNVSTAKQYGDISLLTANEEIGEDVGELFNALTGYFSPREYKRLLVSPIALKRSLLEKIEREIKCKNETGEGHIAIKVNGLVDADIIAALYRASIAGVRVDLNVRGLCCLRPGVPGVSENIRVISIVDRFLEHARIYYFANGGDPEMYMGSSDMMPRNLLARVETLYPVLDKGMMASVRDNILKIHLADNVKARELQPDGSYVPVERKKGEKKLRSQQWLIDHRGCWHG